MKKKSSPLGDIIKKIRKNPNLVIGLAVILVIAAFIYIPEVNKEFTPGSSEAFDGGIVNPKYDPDSGLIGPDDVDIGVPKPWRPEGINTTLLIPDENYSYGYAKIYEDTLVYVRKEVQTYRKDILMMDISNKIITPIDIDANHSAHMPEIYGNYIVYNKYKNGHSWDIYLYNIETQNDPINITNNSLDKNSTTPLIYGNNVVFKTKNYYTNTNIVKSTDIVLYDIYSPGNLEIIKTFSASEKISDMSMYKNYVLWSYKNNDSEKYNVNMIDLNALDQPSVIIDPNPSVNQFHPVRYDDLVVWHTKEYAFGPRSVILFNLTTGKKIAITRDEIYDANEWPSIYGKLIAMRGFLDHPATTEQRVLIEKYDPILYKILADPPEYEVDPSNASAQAIVDLYKNKVIYCSEIYDNPLTPSLIEGTVHMFEITNL